jgi:hypothetical protein
MAGGTVHCACGRTVSLPSLRELRRRATEREPAPEYAGPAKGAAQRKGDAARALPILWIGYGVYLVVRNGWPPRLPIVAVGAGVAVCIGVGLWFVERHQAFRPWRVLIHCVLLVGLLTAAGAVIVWDFAGPVGR